MKTYQLILLTGLFCSQIGLAQIAFPNAPQIPNAPAFPGTGYSGGQQVAPPAYNPSNTDPAQQVCRMSPNGGCLTGVQIGNRQVTDKCLSTNEALNLLADLRHNNLCAASSAYCSIEPNGGCLTGVTVGGVHVTDKCLRDTDEALSLVKALRKLGVCR